MTPVSSSVPAANSLPGEWARYLTFMRSPRLPDAAGGVSRAGLAGVAQLWTLDIIAMAALVGCAALAAAAGLDFPENRLERVEFGASAVFLLVIAAPVAEEIVFRGWLSGRPGHVAAVAALAAGFAIMALAARSQVAGAGWGGLAAFAFFIGAAIVLAWRVQAGPWRWFGQAFPLLFWASTLAFALIHLFNYQGGALARLLPLVVPQLVGGTMFAYARVAHGLWASVLLHIAHNCTAVGLVLLLAIVPLG